MSVWTISTCYELLLVTRAHVGLLRCGFPTGLQKAQQDHQIFCCRESGPPRPADPVGQIIQRKEWERVKPHPSPLCAAYRRKTRFRTSSSGTDTELMRVPTEIRCLLAPPHESVYYLTGYMRWYGGAGSRLGEDAGWSPLQEGGSPSSYSPPIDIRSRE